MYGISEQLDREIDKHFASTPKFRIDPNDSEYDRLIQLVKS